jgi:hypothetical protein
MRKMKGALAGKCTGQPFTANILARLKEPELMQLQPTAPPGISTRRRAAPPLGSQSLSLDRDGSPPTPIWP